MKKYIALIVVLALIFFVLKTLYDAGSFKTIENHSDLTNISIYEGIAGPEDFDVDADNGWLFISSTERWNLAKGKKTNDGIYLLDLKKDTIPYLLATNYKGELHPHGISYFKKGNENYLFVINHKKDVSTVELFKFKNDTLFHLVTFKGDLMCCPNDLVAVDTDKFYVTNDHGYKNGIMRTMEDYLQLPESYLLYFNGKAFSKVYDNLNYANGVMVSSDSKTLYLTETISGKVSVLDRNVETGEANLQFEKSLKTGLDNITLDANGNLWIAAHPKLFDFVGHVKDPAHYSPSQVLKLSPKGDDDFEVTEVYLNDGTQISGSSVALHYKGKIYIGTVYESKLLIGELR
jgi:arylesterase/paraoxonase